MSTRPLFVAYLATPGTYEHLTEAVTLSGALQECRRVIRGAVMLDTKQATRREGALNVLSDIGYAGALSVCEVTFDDVTFFGVVRADQARSEFSMDGVGTMLNLILSQEVDDHVWVATPELKEHLVRQLTSYVASLLGRRQR